MRWGKIEGHDSVRRQNIAERSEFEFQDQVEELHRVFQIYRTPS
jgi:hypothetical protein